MSHAITIGDVFWTIVIVAAALRALLWWGFRAGGIPDEYRALVIFYGVLALLCIPAAFLP